MEPKDLKNSNDELKATPEDHGAVAMQRETSTAGVETEKIQEQEAEMEGFSSPGTDGKATDEFVEKEIVIAQDAAPVEVTKVIPEQNGPVSAESVDAPEEEMSVKEEPGAVQEEMEAMQEGPVSEELVSGQEEAVLTEEPVSEAGEAVLEENPSAQEEVESGEMPGFSGEKPAAELPEDEEREKDRGNKEDQEKQSFPETEDGLNEPTGSEVRPSGKVDYSGHSEVELINALRELISVPKDEDIKDEIERIRIHFYRKHRENIEEEKRRFLEEGGDENEFVPGNLIYEEDLKNLLKDYRQLKTDHAKMVEEEKDHNLQVKYDIIEEIKSLVNRKESINKTFQEFRELQQRWRDTGPVPQSKLKDIWETYHHHVENFYDYIKINRELRDLDLKKNMELKIVLCGKAEELLLEPSIIKAFNILQKYHEQWREIGPVPRDKKDELWERFKAATSKINKKHQEFFEGRKDEQKKNLEAKTALCEKAEEIAALALETHKEWDDKSRELIELQKVWRTIGFTPKKENNRVYERFRGACDCFFNAKREFYSQNKEFQSNNLQMKTDLCLQAEAIKDNTDWKKTTDEFIRIQKKWKEIGPVPRKQSDAIWKRFRVACDYFFDQKSKHFSVVDVEQEDNLALKKALIQEVKSYQLTRDEDVDLAQMREFQRRWTEIGHVPFKDKDAVQNEFRDAVNAHFDHLKIDDQKRNLLKFRSKVSNISVTGRGMNKMRYERDKYVTRLKQMESDLALLNNNIGFFANTKNAESLIDDVNRKIQATQEKIELLKEKIRIIDEMDEED